MSKAVHQFYWRDRGATVKALCMKESTKIDPAVTLDESKVNCKRCLKLMKKKELK